VESIVATEDRMVSPDWSRRVARQRLAVEPIEIPTGHFPMITHPELLAGELAKLDAE
jgi:pimeloyl-ACP methyl ester carboxylesterase